MFFASGYLVGNDDYLFACTVAGSVGIDLFEQVPKHDRVGLLRISVARIKAPDIDTLEEVVHTRVLSCP